MLDKALTIILEVFKDTTDIQDAPYLGHLFRVASKFFKNEVLYIIALLHDLVEDSDWTVEKVREEFNDRIADAIDALSRRKGESYDDYLIRLSLNKDAVKIKKADLLDNCDITRFTFVCTDRDAQRIKKYINAYQFLSTVNEI